MYKSAGSGRSAFLLLIILVMAIAASAASNGHDNHFAVPISIEKLLSVFIQLPVSEAINITNVPGHNMTEPDQVNSESTIPVIEIGETYARIINTEKPDIHALRLEKKPDNVKNPNFAPLLYIEINSDNSTPKNTIIRVVNEWGRNDLVIYHYKGDNWQPLKTDVKGRYLEAVTDSFSIFAVGAPGGINIHLLSDTLVLTNGTVAVAGAAYYDNSTAAAGISIEVNPSWAGSSNVTSDAQGNFYKILTAPGLPGNYTLWVNATSGTLSGASSKTIISTNAALYRTNASAVITNNTTVNLYKNISFPFPDDAVPGPSDIRMALGPATSLEVKVNNITIYNATTSGADLNLTGYLTSQNDINITTGGSVDLNYSIALNFHTTKTAQVSGGRYYNASLIVENNMSYDWNNSSIMFHLPDGAYNISVRENNTNITGSSTKSGDYLHISNDGIGTVYNNSVRRFSVNYELLQLLLNITTSNEEINKGETTYFTPTAYYNGTQIDTAVGIRIYRDSILVYEGNVSGGTPFAYSNNIAGAYNITAAASTYIDGVERTGWNRTYIHIKGLLMYLNAEPALSGRPINLTGRTYYTNNTGHAGRINISIGEENYSTISGQEGYFNYTLPGRKAGTYTISANAEIPSSAASSANTSVQVLDDYFYVISGNLPVVSSDVTLAPNATLWVNQTNITLSTLYIYCKTAIRLLYNPLVIAHKRNNIELNSNISGTFNLPLYPYDYLEILAAFLNTTAEEPANTIQDMAFNLTIDGREINSTIISAGTMDYFQVDSLTGYIPDIFNPGTSQTLKIFNKNTGSSQQYYFTEELYVDYIGHISTPCDLYINVNNNFTYANIGNFTNATVDVSGFRAASNSILLNNCRRTSILGYNLTLTKRYSGYTLHSINETAGKYNITDTILFIPEANLTSVTVVIPLVENARDVSASINGTDVTANIATGENMVLPLPEINATQLINITYWVPILDITPSVSNTQNNRGDTLQILADITYLGSNVSDTTVYANITKAGAAVANLTLNNIYGGTYAANYTLSSDAALGLYNVTVWAYNSTLARDSENTTFRVRGLNVTVSAGGQYIVDNNASITGYVRDIENNSGISGASVNITISNSTFSNSTIRTANSTGYYNFSRPVDAAGDYNVSISAMDANIYGTANTTYRVKYKVSIPLLLSYNRNSSVPVNITVQDSSLTPVPGAAVNSTVMISSISYHYNGTTDINGAYNFSFTNTDTIGYYNIIVNVSKGTAIGNATGSFRIGSLLITEYTDKIEYNAGENVTIQGAVKDIETNDYITNATYNISIYNPGGIVTSRIGNISYCSGCNFWDEDTFETQVEWSARNYYTPVRDALTAFRGSYSLRMTWPGTAGWGGRNFEGSTGLEAGQTSAGYSTTSYPYMSMAYRISADDKINMLILVNNVWKSIALTQGSSTSGSYPTVATWEGLITDDQWHWAQINLDEQLDTSLGTGNHQITAVIWHDHDYLPVRPTGEFWIDDFRISDRPVSLLSYNETVVGLPAGQYTAYVNITNGTITGYNYTSFNVDYNVNTSSGKIIYAIGEVVPINITVFDTNNTPANASISINITRPDAGVEYLDGTAVNGYFNTSFTNDTLEGDYIVSVHAQNASTEAHGDAVNMIFRASGFAVNANFDRSPALYKPGETVNISGVLRDTLGSPRTADIVIRINNFGGEVANTTLPGRNGSYAWNHTLANDSVAGWYTVSVNATTQEGVSGSATAQFEAQLNLNVNTAVHYNPGDPVNVTVFVRNGTMPETAVVDVSVQKYDIWSEFTGTYFDTSKMNATSPDSGTGYYLNFTQNDELIFYTQNLTLNNTWAGKAVQLNTTSLPSHFILDYETSADGTSSMLVARPSIGNTTKYISLNLYNFSDNLQDGYHVYTTNSGIWTEIYSKIEKTDKQKIHFTIEYNSGIFRFYRNGEQFYQTVFTLPADSFIKLNGYAQNPVTGTSADIGFDNVTLYYLSSPVLDQGNAVGSVGNYTFNLTAGTTGMYRVNATTGNSSSYTNFKVRTLNVSSVVYGPYNFNESILSNNTVIPLMVHGFVQDTETHAGITGARVNITILQDGSPRTSRITSSGSGSYVFSFAGDLDSTAAGIFNISVDANDDGILATNTTSFVAYTVNQSWADPYMDYRVPILLYNNSDLAGSWNFDEGVGTDIADSSGNGNTGTLYGASVENPGFETVNSQWGSGAENLVFDGTRSKTGSYSGKIVKLTAGELVQFSSNNADNNAGTTLPSSSTQYKYGGCVYIEGGASAEIFFFSWNSSGGNRYDGTYDAISISGQNQWVCINGTTTNVVPTDNLFAIRVDNNGGGTVWFDDIWANPVEPWAGGKSGNALQFDGMDDYVQVNPSPSLDFSYATYNVWLKVGPWVQQWNANNITVPLFQGVWPDGPTFWIINDPNPSFRAKTYIGQTIYDSNSTIIPIDRDSYHMLTMSVNGTSFRVYLDGVLKYENSSAKGALAPSIFSNPLIIGAATNGAWRDFSGYIDDVKIYNRALSDSEIADIYKSSNIARVYNPDTISFNLALPDGATGSSAVIYDIEGNRQPATIVDMGSYINVAFASTLSTYEGKIFYLYFERPAEASPDSAAMSSLVAPYSVVNGTVEGYKLTITPDKNAYSAGENVVLTSLLKSVTGEPVTSDILTTIYYPNGTVAQINYTLTNISGEARVNYVIPALKGNFKAVTEAAAYGITRKENTSFSVGDLIIHVSTDRTVYNTLYSADINVKVAENENITAADVILKIYNPENVLVFEEAENTKSYWTDTSDTDFNAGILYNVNVSGGSVTLATRPDGRYYSEGSLTSKVYDGGTTTDWGKLWWNAITHPSDSITFYTRTSQNNITWSEWVLGVYNGEILNSSRYIQYRADFATVNDTKTPTLEDVTAELAVPVNFIYSLPDSPLGNYTITVSATKNGNAGYNATDIELDRFDISVVTNKPVYTLSENITVSGATNYRGGNANADVKFTVKKNLAINPSFETDLDANSLPDGWILAGSPWNGTGARDSVSRTGNYSVKVWRSSANITEGLWYYPNMYVVTPGTNYTFSVWAKTDNIAGGNVRLWVTWYNGTTGLSTAINAQKNINAQEGWVLVQGSAMSPGNADNVRIHLVSNIVGNVWFDDVNIEPENNPAVYMANTTSNTYYSFNFSYANASSYIVYSNGSYMANATLNRSVNTIFTVRSLDINVSAGGQFRQSSGNITITGYVADNQTKMAVPNAIVNINITYPDGSLKQYTNTTNALGYYTYRVNTPGLAGTYGVNVSAKDYQNVKGTANATFGIEFTPTLSTAAEYVNKDEVEILTLEVFDDARVDDIEGNTTNWSYRAGTDGTIKGPSPLRHKSGAKSLKVDYDLAAGNEYMFLESGTGAVNVSEYRYITFWLYIPGPDAFNSVALVLENDPTGWSSDERVYGYDPIPGWNYYSFNVSTLGKDLSHYHYLTILLDDDNGPNEVTGTGSLYIDEFRLIKGSPVTGAGVTVNITRPDMGVETYSTPLNIVDRGYGIYEFNYTNTSLYGTYIASSTVTKENYSGVSSTAFGVDSLQVTSRTGGPYVVGDNMTVSGNVSSRMRESAFDRNITINLTYPNGSIAKYYSSTVPATQSHTQSGTYGHSKFSNPQYVNDGSSSTYAYTSSAAGSYIQVTWSENRTISRVKAYYYSQYWPTAYKIQVLDSDGITWVDKKVITGFLASPASYPTIEDRIPTTLTKGVRIYYQTSYYSSYIYIYEMWAYGPEEYSADKITLPVPGNYTFNVTASDSYGVNGSAQSVSVPVRFHVLYQFDRTSYEPGDEVKVYIVAFNGSGYEPEVTVTSQIAYTNNGSVIDNRATTANSTGFAAVNFTVPAGYTSYYINSSVSKNGITGSASSVITTSNLRIWTNKGEVQIGGSAWDLNSAPEEYRNITVKVAALDAGGIRRSGQDLMARIYYPNGSLFRTFALEENDKIFSGSVLFPGKNIPEGNYDIELAEYPGIKSSINVMVWGCVRCHKPNSVSYHYVSHNDVSIAPSTFNLNHSHRSLVYDSCGGGGCHSSYSTNCRDCHTFEGTTNPPKKCVTCHNSGINITQGYLNDTGSMDLHSNINTRMGGPWYGKETSCQSCHGTLNSTEKPTVPLCTNCHPNSSGSGMKVMPGGLSGSNVTLENYEEVSDVITSSGYRYSTVSIARDSSNHSGSYSGKVEYSFGPGYGRVYIDKKNLDLTNATKISLWVYGDNSNTMLYISLNNTRSTKVNWHQSTPVQINWTGWRKISVNIHELSQHDLMYISYADTVRIKLESNSEIGYSGTIFLDDLKKEAVGSHTQYDEVECGVCHGGNHEIKRAPGCQDCHQTQEHGWPAEDKYEGGNATCVNCHQKDATENRIDIANLSEHTEILEDFENVSLFSTDLVHFDQSDIYYSGPLKDNGNHSAVLNYTNFTGYLGGSINITNAGKFKGISVFVNSSNHPGTRLVFGVYTTNWYNYTVDMDWNGWKQFNILYHNSTVNESISFNATGTPGKIWLGVYGDNTTGTLYIDNLRQAVSDDYHQYESWRCSDCHIKIKNLPGITDITSPIVDCSLCHNQNEPHYKQFTRVCMDCHFDSRHGEVDNGNFTNYEKASTCLKCHTIPHEFNQTHLETANCNQCHQQRIHGQNYQNVNYNKSLHLDCERCHGKTTVEAPLPMGLGSPRTTILRLSYTYNNETQCLFCHKNRIAAYELHINSSVDMTNQSLVDRIQNDTVCSTCHGVKTLLNNSDRDELTAVDANREPHAPQIEGHGNVSCYKCHGHRPETLTLNYGSNCVGCHQNIAELTELMPGTLNDSALSNVTNPKAAQLIVHPPQVAGHGNASCSNCHGHVNANLTYVGSDARDCANCHENTSIISSLLPFRTPDSIRSVITNPGGNPLYVIPPQVLGHGNTSCKECHEHAPPTFNDFDFIEGTVCESCHQNASRNVTLIGNTQPDSNNTYVIDNTSSGFTVRSPQVAGHGQTACSVCHSHSAERLVYHGGNNSDCIDCHYNESSEHTLLRNGSSVKSTQITPHQDLNCTVCHSHTPANMTRIKDCRLCHQNATRAQYLTDTYGTGLNITQPAGNISAVQIAGLNHSNSVISGRKWNKTAAYWINGTDSCQYCHTVSRNYSGHNPLGRVSAIAGNSTRNSSLTGSYWCASCHYQGYSSGNATYDDVVKIYLGSNLPVPPEITGNASYGNYVTSNDGIYYYNHAMSNYSDADCAVCHGGTASNTKDFMHGVTEGTSGTECLNCHSVVSIADLGLHSTLNGTSSVDNGDCRTCHYETIPMIPAVANDTNTYYCADCHTSGGGGPNMSSIIFTDRTHGENACADCHVADGKYHQDSPKGSVANTTYVNRNVTGNTTVTDCADCHYASNLDDAPFNAPGGGSHIQSQGGACVAGCHGTGSTMVQKVHNLNVMNWGIKPSITVPSLSTSTVQQGTDVIVNATVTASGTYHSVDGAQYRIMSGLTEIVPWTPMSAIDGNFNGSSDAATARINTSILSSGTYKVEVRGVAAGPAQNPAIRYYPMNGDISPAQNATLIVQTAMGYINGTVTNGTFALAGVKVLADDTASTNYTTGPDGNYSLRISAGTYNITASRQPEYYDNMTADVLVTSNNETIRNFTLTLKSTGTITGSVRSAAI